MAVSRIAAGEADHNYLAGSYRQSCEHMVLTKMRRSLLSERRLRLGSAQRPAGVRKSEALGNTDHKSYG